jgi:Spy/CpxP family protein refolding chaperone
MKMRLRTVILLLAAVLLLVGPARAQETQPGPDAIQQLRLTPEQRQRIRIIFAEGKDDRQVTNRRLREANFALEQALDAEPVNENLIDQRINELAAAQAAQTRMRIRMELKIRRELRPEQLSIWRTLRLQLKDFAGAQRSDQPPAGENLRPNRRPNANTLTPRPRP